MSNKFKNKVTSIDGIRNFVNFKKFLRRTSDKFIVKFRGYIVLAEHLTNAQFQYSSAILMVKTRLNLFFEQKYDIRKKNQSFGNWY